MSIPRLIKEPPLKKRSDAVYPSAAKQPVPLIRIREPPLKRSQTFFENVANSQEYPISRIRAPHPIYFLL
ncbi:unnamed protein product [Caenorhabditis bovis]|nr:unnamed protein product [Caenorhabditis bovis]